MLFEKVDRILGVVPDLDEAMAFFKDVFDIPFDEPLTDLNTKMRVVHSGKFGFELSSPISEEHPIAASESKFIKENGGGLRLIVIKVSNLDQAVQRLKEKGIEPVDWVILNEESKEAIYDPKDTYGIQIVLNQYKDQHPMGVEARKLFSGDKHG